MAKATRYTPEMIREYTSKGYWRTDALSDFWERNSWLYADQEALVDSRARYTWSEANRIINRFVLTFLELGIQKDEVIVLQLPPSAEGFLLRVACEKAGILCLPAARTFHQAEMECILNSVKPAGLVICHEFAGFNYYEMFKEIQPRIPEIRHIFVVGDSVPEGTLSLNEIIERPLEGKYTPRDLADRKFSPFETSLVVHTTGTTGLPKLVEQAMCALLWRGRTYLEVLKLGPKDVVGMFAAVAAGPNGPVFFAAPQVAAKAVILDKWDPEEALKLIQRERITAAFFVPTMLVTLVGHPQSQFYDLSSLRVAWTGGAPMPYHQAVQVEKRLGCPLLQHYGSIDSDVCTITPLGESQETRLMTVGKPLAATEIKLVDEKGEEVPAGEVGEVWGRGPACGPGYFGDEEATRQAWQGGWFKMGDLGKWDEKGNLVIVGRKKDMIIRGGQNIYPVEVEDVLRTYLGIADAAIIGMPDPVMGQRCCAYVVPQAGEKIIFEEIIQFLKKKKFAPYKLPERIEIIDSLPRVGDQQKVDKKILEHDIARKLEAENRPDRKRSEGR
jgi:non-ribosomal peptide synthetase component E (peptide arylation enzyme)